MLFFAMGCAEEKQDDTGPAPFEVVAVDPEDGGSAAAEVAPVQLVLSAKPDLDKCTTDTIRIDALRGDGAIGFGMEVSLDLQSDGNLKVQPAEPYFHGYTYAVTVRGGDSGCADVDRRPILPFYSTFEVL